MRHLVFSAIVLLVLGLALPVAAVSAAREDQRVVVVDNYGNRRLANVHWNVVVHERGDDVTGANGTLKISYLDTGEQWIWRVTGAEGRMSGSIDADRQSFLRLLLTPVGPAKSSGETVAIVTYVQPSTNDQVGRAKVQFAWDIDGEGAISATGDITIKGKKILQN